MAFSLPLLSILCVGFLSLHGSLAESSLCPRSDLDSFVNGITSQCPVWLERSSPEEVSGDKLDIDLVQAQGNAFHSIFFYATWCPFSNKIKPVFDALSSMFPQIRHLAVEESSVMPSVFSKYGVHSFPSIVIANKTTRLHYHGPKDLHSFVNFYEQTTGFVPVAYFAVDESPNSEIKITPSLRDRSLKAIVPSESYLAFSLAFIYLKAFIYFFPLIISRIKAFFTIYALRLNLNHLLERVLHVIDLKKIWSKLRLCNKTRNNARVWASSFASLRDS